MFYRGIDVAKHKHAVSLLDEKGQVVKAVFTITNNRSGFDQLREALQVQPGPVQVGLEATGHYWLAIYDELTRNGHPVTVLNPLQGKFGQTYLDAPTETVKYGTVEIWNIFNLTADTHPMHTHLFNGMVLRRQLFKMQNFQGTPVFAGPGRGPEPYEIGWKETFQCPPGEVTVIAILVEDPMPATFYPRDVTTGRPTVTVTPAGGGGPFTGILPTSSRLQAGYAITGDEFVWHCQILEHEEHDMMRPLVAIY